MPQYRIKCKNCGQNLKMGTNFCPKCGQPIGAEIVDEEEERRKKQADEKEALGCLGKIVLGFAVLVFVMCEGLTGGDKAEPKSKAPKTEVAETKKAKPQAQKAKAEPVKKAEAKPAGMKHARFLKKCYTTAQVMLRSDTTEQATPLAALPYGSELEACIPTSSWYKLTVSLSNTSGAGGKQGYVEQACIMDAKDFTLMNSIWGSFRSRTEVENRRDFPAADFRRALLAYYREKGYSGKLPAEKKRSAGLRDNAEEWQVSCGSERSFSKSSRPRNTRASAS